MNGPVTTRFRSLGGKVFIQAEGEGSEVAVAEAEHLVRDLHARLTRFEPESELCRLNDDPGEAVPAGSLMLRFVEAARMAGQASRGLVDSTLLGEVERAGYTDSIDPDTEIPGLPDRPDRLDTPPRVGDWSDLRVDRELNLVIRPPGLRLDSGGLGKGLAADLVAERLSGFASWVVECSGDLRFGGQRKAERRIDVSSPEAGGGTIAHCFASSNAVATSGVTRRTWSTGSGRSHHLIDPRTGCPSDTGLIQSTAIAPTAVEAEYRAKAALLSGLDGALEWLVHGGVVVTDELEVRAWGFRRGPAGE